MSYQHGKWHVICDRCGRKRYNTEVSKEWTNLIVCSDTCLDMRNPQDFVKPRNDPQTVSPIRSQGTVDANWGTFADVTYDTTSGTQEATIPSSTFDNGL